MNPKIEPAIDEIRAVLKKHNLVGLVFVSNKTHVDFSMEFDADWLCIKSEIGPGGERGVRLRSKAAEYDSKDEQDDELKHAVGTLTGMLNALGRVADGIERMLIDIGKHVHFTSVNTLELKRFNDDGTRKT